MGTTGTALAESPASPRPGGVPPAGPTAVPGEPVDAGALAEAGVGAGAPGAPVEGPSGGPTLAPGSDPGEGPPSGGPTGGGTSGPAPAPDSTGGGPIVTNDEFATDASEGFFELIRNATSPEALEAQNIILRRIALQGDITPSRVPPPLNITEIGGYLNLLTNLNELDMRSQVLAGILGVAGPNPPLGWIGAVTALTFTPVLNDRPAGALQPGLPVTIMVRSDFAGPLRSALDAFHARGAMLPMMSGPLALPPVGGYANAALDPLDYIGRTLRLSSASALSDPAMDALALVRTKGSTDPFALAVRGAADATTPVPPADYEVLQRSPTGIASVEVNGASYVMAEPMLAGAGFIPVTAISNNPADADGGAWAKYRNIGGLTIGTRLGDELRLLHSATEIAGSALAAWENWRWDGNLFAP